MKNLTYEKGRKLLLTIGVYVFVIVLTISILLILDTVENPLSPYGKVVCNSYPQPYTYTGNVEEYYLNVYMITTEDGSRVRVPKSQCIFIEK